MVARLPHLSGRSALGFVDGKVSQEILDVSELMGLATVVGTGRCRKHKKGVRQRWDFQSVRVSHADEGGVTRSETSVVAYHLEGSSEGVPTLAVPSHIPRDLSSVLSDVVKGGFYRAPPKQRNVDPYSVINVRPDARYPAYHGMGWLPAKPTVGSWVLTPSVFAPRGQWALRRMSSSEFLAAHDYPESMVSTLSPLLSDARFPPLRPGKALIAGAAGVLRALSALLDGRVDAPLGVVNEGGDSSFRGDSSFPSSFPSHSQSSKSPQKRQVLVQDEQDLDHESGTNRHCGSNKKLRLDYDSRTPTVEQEQILDEVDRDKRERKATKSDDAEVPVYVWTAHYLEESELEWKEEEAEKIERAMDVMRKWLLLRWKRRVFHSYLDWFLVKGNRDRGPKAHTWVSSTRSNGMVKYDWINHGHIKYCQWIRERRRRDPLELEAASDAVCRAWKASWWEWDDGSRPFHWRWPRWYRKTIRDGLEVYLDGVSPRYRLPQRDESDSQIKEAIKKKLSKVRARRYIGRGAVVSLTSFFAVPKGENDIRMVYDGTKSGLNEAMWVPRFGLPTIETHLRSIEEGTFLADVDVGECFLNFPLHRSLRKLAGVDLTHYFPNPQGNVVWECWHRALMGCKSSPYQAVQGMTVAEEVIRGSPEDKENIFRWDHVRINCPGDSSYDPSKPWCSKVRTDGSIAADLIGYVDDLRTSGPSRREAWHAARRSASILNYLGIQDAPRKRRDSTRTPGAWSGSVVVTRDDGVYVMADTEKWKKAKGMVLEILEKIRADETLLDRKRLEVIRGFLNYVVRTYPSLKPYLTGLHLTIDGWRTNRDAEGWRIKPSQQPAEIQQTDVDIDWLDEIWDWDVGQDQGSDPVLHSTLREAPSKVELKPQLKSDMEALDYLMRSEKPLPRRVRSKAGRRVIYCFGDASRSGFGFTLEIDGTIYYEYGQWNEKADGKSSNWREATNLLEGLRRAAIDYQLEGLEVFIFTDNTTAESTFWKGWSSDKLLTEIVLEMRKLEMEYDLILHVIHVSGSRMIRQGTDGLSRADHSNGVMAGESMIQHVPLNLSAFERSPQLHARFQQTFGDLNFQHLEPREWFDEYHRFGNFIWSPPPAVADAVVDLLNKARHKRPESFHIILVPRLMTGRWRRALTRTSDFYFKIDWKDSWDLEENCGKRLTVKNGIFCGNYSHGRGPYAPCYNAYCGECFGPTGEKPFPIRKFLDDDGVELLDKEDNRFLKARPGDMFMVPFQCEVCHFRNIQKRDPWPGDSKDDEVLEYIRRASLDAFWSRESSTVAKNLSGLIRANKCFSRLGLGTEESQRLGPFPLKDTFGMQAAIAVLDKSLDKGIYEEFVQWETFRKIRSALTNFHQASADGLLDTIASYERSRLWITRVPTHSFFFVRFMTGLHKRVGEVVKQDWPMPIEVLKFIDRKLNRLWMEASEPEELKRIAEMGAWFVVGFCIGLRGEEMVLIELSGTAASLRFLEDQTEPHFVVRLKGRTKAYQIGGSGFEIPCVAVTGVSRLKPGRWIRRLVEVIHAEGRRNGKLFQRQLAVPRLIEFEEDFFQVLEAVQNNTDLIEPTLELRERAGIMRTLRRGVTSHAINMEVDEQKINAINRWRKEFNRNGSRGSLPTIDTYAQLDTLKPTFLGYSKAL